MIKRKFQFSIMLTLALMAMAVVACGSKKNDVAEFEKAKNETRTEIQNAITQIDKILDTAEIKADTLGSETSRAYDSTIQNLKQDKTKLQQRMSELDQTGQEKWQEFKSGVSHDINTAYNKIKDLDSTSQKSKSSE